MACEDVRLCLAVEPPGKANGRMWGPELLKNLKAELSDKVKYLMKRPLVVSNTHGDPSLPWSSHRSAQPPM